MDSKKNNKELQNLLDQTSAELKVKNRELEIEAALERVRTVAMSMQKPDDLADVCKVISEQLEVLNLKNIRNVQLAIIDEEKKNYANYQYFAAYSKQVFEEPMYGTNPAADSMVKAMQESANSFFIGKIQGKELREFIQWRNNNDQFPDPLLDKSDAVYYYFYSIGKGGLGLTTYQKISSKSQEIFKRFHKVFTLAYRRFKDIRQAEAQAREAQIQLGLERVRARAMAMHKSEQLVETAKVLFEQFNLLGKIPDRMSIGIVNEETGNFELWVTDQKGETTDHAFLFRLDGTKGVAKIYKAWKKKKETVVIDLTGQELKDWLQFLKKEVKLPINPANIKGRRVHHAAFFSQGFLLLTSHQPVAEEIMKLLVRFAGVFDLTYTRFLDIQNAEAQAREAQIEAALERVRSRSMGMQSSDELVEASDVMFAELNKLNIDTLRIGICTMDAETGAAEIWSRSEIQGKTENRILGVVPAGTHPVFDNMVKAWKDDKPYFSSDRVGDEVKEYYEKLAPYLSYPERKEYNDRETMTAFFFSEGSLNVITLEPLNQEESEIMVRFARVFGQMHRRFLDLKKAEAQARESEIQLALERVRARTMAMQKSEELADVALVLFQQVKNLGIETWSTGFNIWHEGETSYTDWVVSTAEERFMEPYTVDLTAHPFFKEISKARKRRDDFFMIEEEGDTLAETYRLLFKMAKIQFEDLVKAGFQMPEHQINHYVFGQKVSLMFITFEPCPEAHDIFKRLGKAFEQTYTRFLDLQQAEDQAREAQIEAALERVRSRSMGMQKSEELREVIQDVYEQFVHLKINVDHAGFVVDYKPKGDWHFWIADQNEIPSKITHPWFDSVWAHQFDEAKEKGKDFFATILNFEEKNKFYNELLSYVPGLSKASKDFYLSCPGLAGSTVLFDNVSLYIENFSGTPYSDEENKILMRFGKVFQQTYTRFLDLQNAEEQAREAQIEAALERVRSRTMAMHKSNELGEVAAVLFEQVSSLTSTPDRFNIAIANEEDKSLDVWITDQEGHKITQRFIAKTSSSPVVAELFLGWKKQEDHAILDLYGEKLEKWIRYMGDELGMPFKKNSVKDHRFVSSVFFSHGFIGVTTNKEPDSGTIKLLERFSKIFQQTYVRFLDLQKAEAQAREAQIEAALERVRSKAMAMRNSIDLATTVDTFFSELYALNVTPHRCGMGIINEKTRVVEIQSTTTNDKNERKKITGRLTLAGHPVLSRIYENWKLQKEYHPVLHGTEILDYYKAMNPEVEFPAFADDEIQYGYYFFFKEGGVYAWTDTELEEKDLQIFRRYTSVLSLTYRRYIDLKEAEAQAREAIKQTSLDRVRGEIASMRTSEDLNRITPVIWHELQALEVPFIRCGVFIVEEEKKKVHVYLNTPDGNALGVLNLSYDANALTKNTVDYWRKKEVYKEHWSKEEFVKWTKSMMHLGQVRDAKTYQGSSTAPESLNLHFVPFRQGMLYVGDVSPLTEEKLELVKTLAEAFSIAYARYEDFKNLEEAKNKIEITLNELKSAQNQLVQAEKMASLGELTAGIAHEIQNPLNFVNNFSEVSTDLIEELNEELEKGDVEEVQVIATDLLQNLEKINHHGKRASNIVKSMLEHSRTGSAEKQPTDLNALADEYLRLAYHGLRAKDKSFNADFRLEVDENLPKINVVPQDIGRVLLNLINNAFFAVSEKAKKNPENYKPDVVVKTELSTLERGQGGVTIRIHDNGSGIPIEIKDKIFQPFFTTKPTGQGTGLGLSMSYDIVTKGHGGELKVETKEGEGSEFIIHLPLKLTLK